MSRRWQGHEPADRHTSPNQKGSNIAAQYAMQLESFHISFTNQPQFCMNVLGYSQDSAGRTVDSLLPSMFSVSPTSPNPIQSSPRHQHTASFYNNNLRPSINRSTNHSNATQLPTGISDPSYPIETSSPQNVVRTPQGTVANLGNHEWQNFQNSQRMGITSNIHLPHNNTQQNIDYDSVSVDDELTAMSDALLGQQFLEMDRVITYQGTNFAIGLDGWPSMN